MRKLLASLMLGIMLLGGATPASAHAQLESATPKARSVLYVLPVQIRLMFDDDLTAMAEANQIQVTDPKGKRVDTGLNEVVGNQLNTGLKKSTLLGKYTVSYRVLSADGHPVSRSYWFTLTKKPSKTPARKK